MSINGKGGSWSDIGDCYYAEKEHDIILKKNMILY
jgi:hypothetical protein